MKKIGFLIFVFFLFYSPFAMAQTSADSNSKVDISQDFSDHSSTSVIQDTKRPQLYVSPGPTGTFVLPPGTLDGGDWKPFLYQPLLKEFSCEQLDEAYKENIGAWDKMFQGYIKTAFVGKPQAKNTDSIIRLDWYPTGNDQFGNIAYPDDRLITETEITGKEEWTDITPFLLALREAKVKSGTRRVVVFFRPKKEAYNAGISIGAGGGGGRMVGKNGATDDEAIAIGLGGLIGKTWAGIWRSFDFKILALNDGPVEPPQSWKEMLEAKRPKPPTQTAPDALQKSLDRLNETLNKLATPKAEAAAPPDPRVGDLQKKVAELEDRLREKATPPVVPVSAPTEKEKIEMVIIDMPFDFNQTKLTQVQKKFVSEKIVPWVKEKKSGSLIYAGFADIREIKKDGANPKYGQKRARSLRDAVEPHSNLKSLVFSGGSDNLRVKNAKSESEHAKNRIGIMIWVPEGIDPDPKKFFQ